jgi:hypothetical protein
LFQTLNQNDDAKIMKKHTITATVAAFVALCITTGCKHKPSAFPLSVASLGEIHSGQISYEEHDGEIFVSITDPSGDCHIHRLDYSGYSKQAALEVLTVTQAELEKADKHAAAAKIQKCGGENWAVLKGDWSVETKDIPGILTGSKAYLEKLLAETPPGLTRENLTKILADWDSYSCQLQPLLDRMSGANSLGMQFFPTRDQIGMFKHWRTEPVLVKGGGYSCWHLTYDPDKRDYSGFSVNATQ